jgi:hypothetical protein
MDVSIWIESVGRDSSVGIATGYGLDGPGIECRWGRDFPHSSIPALRPTQPPLQTVPAVKRPGRDVDHPPPSSAEVKERVYLLPLWAYVACSGVNCMDRKYQLRYTAHGVTTVWGELYGSEVPASLHGARHHHGMGPPSSGL